MSGLRFVVGEMAIMALGISAGARRYIGSIAEVVEAGTLVRECISGAFITDYLIKHEDGRMHAVHDYQLRKLTPPAEPASLTRNSECEVEA